MWHSLCSFKTQLQTVAKSVVTKNLTLYKYHTYYYEYIPEYGKFKINQNKYVHII